MSDKLITIKRICVNDCYYILREYPDKISLQHIYFLENGLEERYKYEYNVLTTEEFLSLLFLKNYDYVSKMQNEAFCIESDLENWYV